MNEHEKLKLEYARLLGEFQGTLIGIVYWDIPEELRGKLQAHIKRLKQLENGTSN
jgi:hypothetical protein